MQVAVLLVIAVIVGIVFRGVFTHNSTNFKKQSALSPSPTSEATIVPTGVSPTIVVTNTPATPPGNAAQYFQATQPPASGISINDFIYPGSSFIRNDGSAVAYSSNDNTSAITNWYKQKISNLHMNAQSMVETNANGNIQNSFVAANASAKVNIIITKHSSDQSTEIKISTN